MSGDPVAITALPGAAAATVAWRQREELFVTAVVKATFSLVPDGPMTAAAPEPIAPGEEALEPGGGLRSAGDLAPYLERTDVFLIGHATIPAGRTDAIVRLGVLRDGVALLDAWVELDASRRGRRRDARARIEGMGPIPRDQPARQQLLGGCDPRRLAGQVLDLPDGFDWGYFQAAPSDQQMERLEPEDWISLEGVFVEPSRLLTRFPAARAAATLRGPTPELEAGRSFRMVADTILLDVDRGSCSILWRGSLGVPEEVELGSLHVVAGVIAEGSEDEEPVTPRAAAGRSAELLSLGRGGAALGYPPPGAETAEHDVDDVETTHHDVETTHHDVDDVDDRPTGRPPPMIPPHSEEHTAAIDLEALQRKAALPFRGGPAAPSPRLSALPFRAPLPAPLPPPSSPPRRGRDPLVQTRDSEGTSSRPALPFAAARTPIPIAPVAAPIPIATVAAPSAAPLVSLTPVLAPAAPLPERLPLDVYAAIKADLWAVPAAQAPRVLAARGMTEVEWLGHEQRFADALAAEIAEGRTELARAVRAAILAAEDRRKDALPELSLDEFVALRVACEAAVDPAVTLAERGLTSAAFRRLRRHWLDRARADRKLSADLRARLAAARA